MPNTSHPKNSERTLLRKRLRAARASLSPSQQSNHAYLVFLKLSKHPWLRQARHIGLYLAHGGELSTTPWINWARQHHKQLHLPVISGDQIHFKHYQSGTSLALNHYAIPEPQGHILTPPETLDVLLMPLVGFDKNGGRLGMGGGFYDRLLAKLEKKRDKTPRCIGLAHQLQGVESLPTEYWDKPVEAIATEKAVYTHRLKRR